MPGDLSEKNDTEFPQALEVVGKLIWNKSLVDGHYEINGPSSVTCRGEIRTATSTPSAPPARAVPSRGVGEQAPAQTAPLTKAAPARSLGPRVWVGRYRDSRGAGDVTFTLVRGESTVSGTWKFRTGGGGPITGLVEPGGRRVQLRMENIAPECPGTFEGSGELDDTSLVATYRGNDCEGAVTEGQLELRPR